MISAIFMYAIIGFSFAVMCNHIQKTTNAEAFLFFAIWPIAIILVAAAIMMIGCSSDDGERTRW